MRIWLVFVAVGMLVLLGCGSNSAGTSVPQASAPKAQVQNSSVQKAPVQRGPVRKAPTVVEIPTPDTLQIQIDEYVYEIGNLLDDLVRELDDYEDGTDTPSYMDADRALRTARNQAEDSQRTFRAITSSVSRLNPPNSGKHRQFHNELENCLRDLIRGNDSRIDYYREVSMDLDTMAKFSADDAGRELNNFYREFKDVLRKYNNL
tara:strand:+ start:17 stop:631 length:615 start_codon:yes stop_codon:yes gene_type:complete